MAYHITTFPWPTTLQHFHGLQNYNISMAYKITTFPWPTTLQHFHGLQNYNISMAYYITTFPWPTTLQHFHVLPNYNISMSTTLQHFHGLLHYNISMGYHIRIICVFLWIPENFTLRDTFSYVHSMLYIDFIDAITSKTIQKKDWLTIGLNSGQLGGGLGRLLILY